MPQRKIRYNLIDAKENALKKILAKIINSYFVEKYKFLTDHGEKYI
jgi:hypothetical protein